VGCVKPIRQAKLRPTASPGEAAIANINRIDCVAGQWNRTVWKQTAFKRDRIRIVLKNSVNADRVIATPTGQVLLPCCYWHARH
jgi:hypothetical protein